MSGEFGALQPHVSRLKKGEGNMGLFSTLSHSVKVIVQASRIFVGFLFGNSTRSSSNSTQFSPHINGSVLTIFVGSHKTKPHFLNRFNL